MELNKSTIYTNKNRTKGEGWGTPREQPGTGCSGALLLSVVLKGRGWEW